MRYTIDRIEEKHVVCEQEDKTMQIFEREEFPEQISAGDVVEKQGTQFVVLVEETRRRREYMKQLMDCLWEE